MDSFCKGADSVSGETEDRRDAGKGGGRSARFHVFGYDGCVILATIFAQSRNTEMGKGFVGRSRMSRNLFVSASSRAMA